jgi:CheY-like chemotaxis protein
VLGAGHYDVVFVESTEHAYSNIKRHQPHLVILCVRVDDTQSLQVLSMLKLDEETRAIPVLTYATEPESGDADNEDEEAAAAQIFGPESALRMN